MASPRLFAALAAAVLLRCPAAFAEPVYDDDDRRDPSEVSDRDLLGLADSTVALFPSDSVTVRGGWAELATKPYGEKIPLCEGERFAGQKVGADCSGALVTPDVVATAGHCVKSKASCGRISFVFGFKAGRNGKTPERVPASEVYSCQSLIDRASDAKTGEDWALVSLDRPVLRHSALPLRAAAMAQDDPVLVIGHPLGLPAKVAGGGRVRDAGRGPVFTTDLDTFHGNSGSPVFHAGSLKVAGILTRGESDFDAVLGPDGKKCLRTRVCRNGACSGEIVTKASAFSPALARYLKAAAIRSSAWTGPPAAHAFPDGAGDARPPAWTAPRLGKSLPIEGFADPGFDALK
ncbi:MAG: trypsin-like peptidase domain-containing protein [Elusimicrobia bacterium]|nr:trypsin-like peptidase domain-containing protein [Elusimicrobiota bacterium]